MAYQVHGVSLVWSQLCSTSCADGPFKLFFHERRAWPCGLTAKVVSINREKEKIKVKEMVHGLTGITKIVLFVMVLVLLLLQNPMKIFRQRKEEGMSLGRRDNERKTKSCFVGYQWF